MAANPSIDRYLYSSTIPHTTNIIGYDPSPVALTDPDAPGYYEVSFSPGSKYYVLSYKGPQVPWQRLKQVAQAEETDEGECRPCSKCIARDRLTKSRGGRYPSRGKWRAERHFSRVYGSNCHSLNVLERWLRCVTCVPSTTHVCHAEPRTEHARNIASWYRHLGSQEVPGIVQSVGHACLQTPARSCTLAHCIHN